MSSPEAYSAIHDYLATQWAARTPLVFENEQFELPDTPAYYVQVEIFGDFFDQASIGGGQPVANLWREEGQILAHVMCPRWEGTLQGRTYGRLLCDLFRGQEFSGIRFRRISLGASEPGDEDGNYFRMTASIDWQRDEP
ncbi:hypothetical protein [Rhizobium oryzicola]|uniref:DUF3168 domain-containing protein n=1 Tax=Rhizobium oryzicola TaxID=1232668 RepID=A0ABT8SVF8_9HYPH|nr:hypothetical protein [Rhizobium oryzicola]MDO1582429.1 hypothetical protein [Rhizobium oryzicola]